MARRKQPRGATTLKGVGHRHRQQAEWLKKNHRDGIDICWWCGEPMWLAQGLSADHSVPRAIAGPFGLADRLLHGSAEKPCNSERGDGSRDHLRPALTGKSVDQHEVVDLGIRAMAWPDR